MCRYILFKSHITTTQVDVLKSEHFNFRFSKLIQKLVILTHCLTNLKIESVLKTRLFSLKKTQSQQKSPVAVVRLTLWFLFVFLTLAFFWVFLDADLGNVTLAYLTALWRDWVHFLFFKGQPIGLKTVELCIFCYECGTFLAIITPTGANCLFPLPEQVERHLQQIWRSSKVGEHGPVTCVR